MAAVRLRPIALPIEHGGWSLLGAPILLGLWVAPSVAGAWIALAALGGFLTRQPLKLAIGDWRRGKRYPRSLWAERFALLYAAIALLAIVMAVLTTSGFFWLPLLLAAPLALVQLSYDLRQQSRAIYAELCGAAAISSVCAAIALAAGQPLGLALQLWLLMALQATTAVHYVHTRIRLARDKAARPLDVYLAHGIAIGLAWAAGGSWLVIAAFALLALRAAIGLLPRMRGTPLPLVGVQELGFSLAMVAALALG